MKIICPICGKTGFLQKRKNSRRIQHYVNYENRKRRYLYHPLPKTNKMEVNGSKPLEVKTLKIDSNHQNKWTGRDLNPRPPRCQRGDHTRLIYPPLDTFL